MEASEALHLRCSLKVARLEVVFAAVSCAPFPVRSGGIANGGGLAGTRWAVVEVECI